MKKALFLLLVLLIALPLLSCKKKEEAAAVAAPEAAKYKIGIAFDVGGRGDQSFNDSAYNGLVLIAKEFKGYIKDDPDKVDFGRAIEMKYMQTQSGGQDRETLLRVLAEEGYNLIIGVGFLYSDSLAKVAKDFPNVHFGLVDGYIPDLTGASNITCLAFAEHEGSFLLGAIAGLKNQGGKVGFIGGMDIPLIHKFHGGFFAGAMYVNPALRQPGMLLGQYCGKDPSAFNDPKTAESIAANMYKQGASIVYHAAGASGSGLFKAAKDQKKIAMGVDSDQGLILASASDAESKAMAEQILTSMLKRVDVSVYLTGKELIETGKNTGGYRTFGLADNGVGYAVNQYNEAKLADVKARIEEIKAKIISGAIKVPDDDAKVAEWTKTAF
jgi:basic membrane protein A